MRIHVKNIDGVGDVRMEIPTVADIVEAAQAGNTVFLENLEYLAMSQLVQHQFSGAARYKDKTGNLAPRVGKPGRTQVWKEGDVWRYNWSTKPNERGEFTQADQANAEIIISMMAKRGVEISLDEALAEAKAERLAKAKASQAAFGVGEVDSSPAEESAE